MFAGRLIYAAIILAITGTVVLAAILTAIALVLATLAARNAT